MSLSKWIQQWFSVWESGNFRAIPVTDDFVHVSPFGTIEGKDNYLKLVEANRDKFLGHRFLIHDQLVKDGVGCVRYTAINGDFELEVSEWHYASETGIKKIIAYYQIGDEIGPDRQLSDPET